MEKIKNYRFTNWAESYTCFPEIYFEPKNEDQLKEILLLAKENGKKIRIVGAGLSPSDLCCTDDYMICMKNFDKVLEVNKEKHTVLAEGGIIISRLIDLLKQENLAINMMPCIINLSLAGMISTGSHNTGVNYPISTGYVLHMDIMKADGTVVSCSGNDPDGGFFRSAGCGLGSLGVILRLTIQCAPLYFLKLDSECVQFDKVVENLEKIASSSDHTRMFYVPYHDKITVQKMNRITPCDVYHPHSYVWDDVIGFLLLQLLYFISLLYQPLVKYINRLYQRLFYDSPYQIIDSYENVFTFDVKFRQYVSEWSIPLENTGKALLLLKKLVENSKFPAHLPVEIRFVDADSFYLSPAFGRRSTYMNVLSYRPYGFEPAHHKEYFKKFADIMISLDGRPHLAKDHPFIRNLMENAFPKFRDFCRCRKNADPDNIFVNKYVERVIGVD